MNIKGIAINIDSSRVDGNFEILKQELDYYEALGYEYVELSPHGCGVMINGQIIEPAMNKLLKILDNYKLKFTIHGPNQLNLMNLEQADFEAQAFKNSIDFASRLNSPIIVYHAGRYRGEETFRMPLTPISPERREVMLKTEINMLSRLGDYAAERNVTICVENARPYLDIGPYSYGESLFELVEIIKEINHSHVGIGLDVGHAYLAACHYGFDLLRHIDIIAPYVKHLHLHDNFGKVCASYEKRQYDLAPMGRGDMHLPVGMGIIPIKEILNKLPQYQGILTVEIRSRYKSFADLALANTKQIITEI